MIEIYIKGNPSTKTAQMKGVSVRNGYAHFYTKKEVKRELDALAWELKKYVPDEPISGPVALSIKWAFELKKAKFLDWKITRPDLDNLEKGLLDLLTKMGFWKDDAQICLKLTHKYQCPPGEGFLLIRITNAGGVSHDR